MKEPREIIAKNMASASVFGGTTIEYLPDADEIVAALKAAGYVIKAESALRNSGLTSSRARNRNPRPQARSR